jgi:hypothetical protein
MVLIVTTSSEPCQGEISRMSHFDAPFTDTTWDSPINRQALPCSLLIHNISIESHLVFSFSASSVITTSSGSATPENNPIQCRTHLLTSRISVIQFRLIQHECRYHHFHSSLLHVSQFICHPTRIPVITPIAVILTEIRSLRPFAYRITFSTTSLTLFLSVSSYILLFPVDRDHSEPSSFLHPQTGSRVNPQMCSFTIDNDPHFRYRSFFDDFGPPSIAQLVNFARLVEQLLTANTTKLVHFDTSPVLTPTANSALYISFFDCCWSRAFSERLAALVGSDEADIVLKCSAVATCTHTAFSSTLSSCRMHSRRHYSMLHAKASCSMWWRKC